MTKRLVLFPELGMCNLYKCRIVWVMLLVVSAAEFNLTFISLITNDNAYHFSSIWCKEGYFLWLWSYWHQYVRDKLYSVHQKSDFWNLLLVVLAFPRLLYSIVNYKSSICLMYVVLLVSCTFVLLVIGDTTYWYKHS